MYVGMRCRAYPGGLVVVQQRAADVEQRAEDDVGEREGGTLARVALGVEQPLQSDLCDDHDEHER
jgi:hypothetical protein